ncbi:MAG: sulfotransferase [Propionibacteriales bacterium]|nr:sulfotransferase [Propionibacteriales bacterium]
MSVPNFLYIGTSKAGSTWLFNALAIHPDVYLASSKGLYYFDQHFGNGPEWYRAHFTGDEGKRAVGEISHSYLSSPAAADRIAVAYPDMRLLACLREPVDRAFSDYLDLVKNGQHDGSFETALERFPRLIDRGRYATHLQRYVDAFPRHQLQVGLFDDLRADAQAYADDVFAFLQIQRLELPSAALKGRMPAGSPRNANAAAAAKASSRLVKRIGLRRLRARVKRSVVVRQALYRPYADDRPTVDPGVATELRGVFADEVERLDTLLSAPVTQMWGYRAPQPDQSGGG